MGNLILSDVVKVDGIYDKGLEIQGNGTFKFTFADDNGRPHNICILNSLYLPGLKKKYGWGNLWIAAFCIGVETSRPYLTTP